MEAKDMDGPWEEWRGDVWTVTDELICNPSNFDGRRRALARRIVKEHNSHDALVEALKLCAGVLSGSDMSKSCLIDALGKARAAIALAGETP